LDFEKEYVRSCIKFLLQREAQHSSSYISVWVNQLKEIKSAKAVILFGSVLAKESEARDIDAVIITDNKNLKKVEEEIKKINVISYKRVHPLFQTEEDLKSNINLEDKVILNAIKGIVVLGHEIIINAIKK
jgi:predicted nucleotidyltransferase